MAKSSLAAAWNQKSWQQLRRKPSSASTRVKRHRARRSGSPVLPLPPGRRVKQTSNKSTLHKRKSRAPAVAQSVLANFIIHSIRLGAILKVRFCWCSDVQRCLRLGHNLLAEVAPEKATAIVLYDVLLRDPQVSQMFDQNRFRSLQWLVNRAMQMRTNPSVYWSLFAGQQCLAAARGLPLREAVQIGRFFAGRQGKSLKFDLTLKELKKLLSVDIYLAVHIAFTFGLLLDIRWTGDTLGPCSANSPRVSVLSSVLPFETCKKKLVEARVQEARNLTGRDLALIACETIKLLDRCGIADNIEELGAEGLKARLGKGQTKMVLAAMAAAEPIPEETRTMVTCPRHGESLEVDRAFQIRMDPKNPPSWYRQKHVCKGATNMTKALQESLKAAGYQQDLRL